VDYLRFDVGHRYGGTDSEAFYQLNPNRTVPVLQDDENPPLWETGAILRYLASRYADDAFWPGELLARTEVDRWAEWSKQNIALGFTAPVFWRVVRTPAAERDPQAIAAAVTALEQKLAIAEARLAGSRYLVGDTSPWPISSLAMCCTATLPSISPVVPPPPCGVLCTANRTARLSPARHGQLRRAEGLKMVGSAS
jgi:glutathione S-transferase